MNVLSNNILVRISAFHWVISLHFLFWTLNSVYLFLLLSHFEIHEDKNHICFIFQASNTELYNASGIESNVWKVWSMTSLSNFREGFHQACIIKQKLYSCFQMCLGYNPRHYCCAWKQKHKTLNSTRCCWHIIQTNPHFTPSVNNLSMCLLLQTKGMRQVMLCRILQRSKCVFCLLSWRLSILMISFAKIKSSVFFVEIMNSLRQEN